MPPHAILAIGYWVLLGSVTGYFLLTWGNTYVDASMVSAYFTVQVRFICVLLRRFGKRPVRVSPPCDPSARPLRVTPLCDPSA